jgi:hypothetical protein
VEARDSAGRPRAAVDQFIACGLAVAGGAGQQPKKTRTW